MGSANEIPSEDDVDIGDDYDNEDVDNDDFDDDQITMEEAVLSKLLTYFRVFSDRLYFICFDVFSSVLFLCNRSSLQQQHLLAHFYFFVPFWVKMMF